MSRNCRQVRLIVNAVYRNRPDLERFAVGSSLPQWIEDDFWFEMIFNQTGTSTSRRGEAPVPILRKRTAAYRADALRRANVVRQIKNDSP